MPNALVKSFSRKYSMSVSDVEDIWKDKSKELSRSVDKTDKKFFPILVGLVKKSLKKISKGKKNEIVNFKKKYS